MRRRTLLAGAGAIALAACSAPIAPPDGASRTLPPTNSGSPAVRLDPVAVFDEPWALAFLPGTPFLAITRRPGELLLRNQGTGEIMPVSGVPPVLAEGQGGLGDIVPAPDFETSRTVYLSWAEAGDGELAGAAVGRARLVIGGSSARLESLRVIWRQEPKVTGRGQYGHRLAFSPDGSYLFVSSGERQHFTPAQDLNQNLGKILRLLPDGSAAPGNPFADRGRIPAQIWSLGHRNPLGLAFDSEGRLWETEMGPKGGDEVNLILPGRNYGWPLASNGSNYDGTDIPDHRPGDGFEPPKVWWNPSISPGSLMIYSGDTFPRWRGSAFIGALSGQALIRVALDGESATKADQWNLGARIRAVVQDPDGSIWLAEDGAGAHLLHLTPA